MTVQQADDAGSRSQRIGVTFLTGVIGILPLALTFLVLAWVVKFFHDLVGPGSPFGNVLVSIGMSVAACETTAYLIGVVGVLLAVYGLGVLTENGAGIGWRRTMDQAICRVPAIGTVYDASKHVTSMFERKPESFQSMTPVMCFFGDGLGVGTPALMPTSELVHFGGHAYHVVILPTAPVPFGGALVCIRQEWVKPAECTLEELIGIYVSMGVTAPRCMNKTSRADEVTRSTPLTTG
ncbi:DUF502 domain-containing protein [Planctomicrobium piriforme]|uniref:Uncharacterized membrane protein n=1 Tax=Planctomicrobium piriforme TaxID=1576369 RepID=A0A1I3FH10_9PLAN|nr:DUF502 domain-containing protein [Planctomicrobium piriforme]SFI10495.1 Uncharacterized membrane protein [Planctomicrobium piriforme]